jgi:hypothetical protein
MMVFDACPSQIMIQRKFKQLHAIRNDGEAVLCDLVTLQIETGD